MSGSGEARGYRVNPNIGVLGFLRKQSEWGDVWLNLKYWGDSFFFVGFGNGLGLEFVDMMVFCMHSKSGGLGLGCVSKVWDSGVWRSV